MAYTTKLNQEKSYDTIRWTGRDTRGLFRWIAYGDSYEAIWNATLNRVNVSDDEEEFRLARIGKTIDDFLDENGDIMGDEYWLAVWSVNMTDEDYKELLISCKGNAYYQTFEHWNGEEWIDEE